MRDLGATPLTWTFVKLLGRQLRDNVRDWDGLPNSHAWAASGAARPHQLLTKAQCVGVLVSIHQRAERVELLVDDGTALVRAVQWTPTWNEEITLGDLVRVEGKLNMDSSWANETNTNATRELRVVRIRKISDPNEEMLHWMDVAELTTEVYASGADAGTTLSSSPGGTVPPLSQRLRGSTSPQWDNIVIRVFHDLKMDDTEVESFLSRPDQLPHDQVLIDTLRDLLRRQRELTEASPTSSAALRFTFPEFLRHVLASKSVAAADALHHATTRSLRHAFAMLRGSGLIYLEDTDADQYLFLSAEFVLAPALTDFLQKKKSGASVPEIAEWVLTQERFKRVSIDSIEQTLHRLRQLGQLEQKDDSQRFIFNWKM